MCAPLEMQTVEGTRPGEADVGGSSTVRVLKF